MAVLTSGFTPDDFKDTNAVRSRLLSKTQTFDGTANNGAIGAVPLFTVTGVVLIERILPNCKTNLAGATATLALGVTGSTALFIAATTGTNILATTLWVDTGPDVGGIAIPAALQNVAVKADIIGTVATAALTGGVIQFDVLWRPISPDGNLA